METRGFLTGSALLLVIQCGLGAGTCFAAAGAPTPAPLLTREQLFAPPQRSLPQLSPDGKRIAYLAPDSHGVANIWLSDSSLAPSAKDALTHDTRGLSSFRWAEDDIHILYWQDNDGDEGWHLHGVDTRTGENKDLTPFTGVSMQNLLLNARHPHEVLVGLNKRSRMLFDMYRINLDDGSSRLEATNPGDVLSWTADRDFEVRVATAFLPGNGSTIVRVRDKPGGPWRDLVSWRFEDAVFPGQINGGSVVAGFTADGSSLYLMSATGSDHAQLTRIELASGQERTVVGGDCDLVEDDDYSGTAYDIRPMVLRNPETGEPDAVALDCAVRRWQAVNPAVRADLEALQARTPGFPVIIAQDRANTRWIVATLAGDRPIEYSLYERTTHTFKFLFSQYPELAAQRLPRMTHFKITARDGLQIPVYLAQPAGGGRHPLILCPHGGPWARDHDEFDPVTQLLVNRGYAVLWVEYRGSTGFGKAFLNAGNHEYGLKTRDDAIDAVEWTIHNGIADPQRIGVLGFSAGGYLALRVTEARPDLFRATIDVFGPTDVAASLATIPPNWEAVKTRWVRRIGDAEHDEALNLRISPRFEHEPIPSSLFVAQGVNDVRVKKEQSDALVTLLRKRGTKVTYVVYRDEGHGFVRPENNLDFYGRVEEYLAQRLGGRAQPWRAQPGAQVEIH
jgi:dipeptidyl aminopeptidase/acylaminoacyl peptidase